MVKDALAEGGDSGFLKAGRSVMLGIIMHLVLGFPVLLVWYYNMQDVVCWLLVKDDRVARVSGKYASVIVFDYMIRGTTRAFMLPFHLSGQAMFERNVDVGAGLATIVAIFSVSELDNTPITYGNRKFPALKLIGSIQLIIGVAKTIVKIAYVSYQGRLQPYIKGMMESLILIVSLVLIVVSSIC
jgi:hypothetical protein